MAQVALNREVRWIPLKEARICLDCDCIYSGNGPCPGCGGKYSYHLSKWIKPIDCDIVKVEVTR